MIKLIWSHMTVLKCRLYIALLCMQCNIFCNHIIIITRELSQVYKLRLNFLTNYSKIRNGYHRLDDDDDYYY